jgi:hypothetical protein
MKNTSDGEWKDVDASVQVEINGDGEELLFRTVNLAEVPGPEHRIVFARGERALSVIQR